MASPNPGNRFRTRNSHFFRRLPLMLFALLAVAAPMRAVGKKDLTLEDAAARARLPVLEVIPAAPPEELTPAREATAAESFRSWPVSHGDAGSRRYSALTQINRSNVRQLQEAWRYHSGVKGGPGLQANPIVVDGILYAPVVGQAIAAIDATTGREIWRHQLEKRERNGLEDAPARRGLVYWPARNGLEPRIVFASGNWVYALDSKTGRPSPEFGENGRTPLPTGGTAVGVIWNGTYIVAGLGGDIFSYNLENGRSLWRFHTVPRPGEFGADTWKGTAKGGANCWGGLALDEVRGIVYAAIGAPHPNFTGNDRLGDNLFADCLVALDARTGKRLWHFQDVRHDLWDLDNPAPPNLVTITREGRRYDAVACVTKTGHTLLLDRVSGKPVFPFERRRAPVSKLPGEVTSPYQPDPKLPEPFATVEFTRNDITDRTPDARAFVELQLSRANMGWYLPMELGRPTAFFGIHGGSEWPGASVDVETGRLYVAANHIPWTITIFRDDDPPPAVPATAGEQVFQQMCAACHGADRKGVGMAPPLRGLRHAADDAAVIALLKSGRNAMPPMPPLPPEKQAALLNFLFARDRPQTQAAPSEKGSTARYAFSGYRKLLDNEGYPGSKPPWGTLNCIDLNTGKQLWRVPLGEYDELTKQGLPRTGTENFGGPMVTAGGLVFCAGTRDEKIRAFDKDTGKELWSAKLPWGGYAPPATYEAGGRQYVVIAATGGGKLGGPTGDAWVAFALPEAK